MKAAIPMAATVANEWTFDPASILSSPRKVKGKFHTPKVDRDNEYIEKTAVQNAVPDFMHLPILHDFHKERTVGIVTRVVELSDGSFDFEGLIKATDDCNDIWDLIQTGGYNQVSIYGKRTCGSSSCQLKPEQRSEPCTTTGVRLDSISVCDSNARNDGTSLMVAKGAKVRFMATDEIIKAETTSSNLMHTATDYPKFGKDGLPRTKKKCTATCPQYERQELGKGDDMDEDVEHKPIRVGDKAKRKEPSQGEDYHDGKFEKGAESVESMLDSIANELETLVADDESALGESPHATDQVQPSGNPSWGEQPKPESQREYGISSDSPSEEEKAGWKGQKFPQNKGDAGAITDRMAEDKRGETKIPDHAKHLAAQYLMEKHYEQAERDNANKVKEEANTQRGKEEYIHPKPKETLRPDSATSDEPVFNNQYETPTEEKASFQDPPNKVRPPWAKKEVGYAAHQDLQPVLPHEGESKRESEHNKERDKIASENAPRPRGTPPKEPETKEQRKLTTDPFAGKVDQRFNSDTRGDVLPPTERVKRTDMDEPRWKKPDQSAQKPPWSDQKHSSEREAAYERTEGGTSQAYLPNKEEAAENAKRPEPVRPKTLHSERPVQNEGEESILINRRVPDGTEPTHSLEPKDKYKPVPKHEYTKPEYHTEHKEFTPQTEVGKKFKSEVESDNFGNKQSRPSAEGGNREQTKEYEEKAEDSNEIPDIETTVRRLADIVTKLVRSDRKVHSSMGSATEEKCSICKGTETMEDKEVDMLVKAKVDAKVDEIAKAYQVQVDELKKANTDLAARIEKMEKETIEKSGVVAIIREGDEDMGTVFQTNAKAISAITKAKV
jgi:hypothetical protein